MWMVRCLIDIAIPALTAYLASDDYIVEWLIKKQFLSNSLNVEQFQRICLFINIIFTTFIINMRLAYHSYKEKKYLNEIFGLYNMIKKFAHSNFVYITKNNNFSFDLRIFVPEINIFSYIKTILMRRKREKWFVIRNIEPFGKKDITENLKFRVDPNEQGLVGDAYKSGSIVYDDKLSLTNNTNYSLEQTQLSRTSNLRWSICVPISNDNNEVIAVMAFDSDSSELDIGKNKNELKKMTNTLAIMMRDSVPELFKKKWSIK